MGLDVVAISRAKWMGLEDQPEEDETDDNMWLPYFPLPRRNCEGLRRGFYRSGKDEYGFRVGNYAACGRWVEDLARMALKRNVIEIWENPRKFRGQPFVELICTPISVGPHFGPITSGKLYRDFASNARRAKRYYFKPRKAKPHDVESDRASSEAIRKFQPGLAAVHELAGSLDFQVSTPPENDDISWMWEVYWSFRLAFRIARDGGFLYYG